MALNGFLAKQQGIEQIERLERLSMSGLNSIFNRRLLVIAVAVVTSLGFDSVADQTSVSGGKSVESPGWFPTPVTNIWPAKISSSIPIDFGSLLKANKRIDQGLIVKHSNLVQRVSTSGRPAVPVEPSEFSDIERLRAALQGNPRSQEYQRALDTLRARGRKIIGSTDPYGSGQQNVRIDLADYPEIVVDKLPLKPLSEMKPPEVVMEVDLRMASLREEIGKETNPVARDRLLLTLSAYHVGQGDWSSPKALYEALAANSSDPEVRVAAGRNLRVVEKNLELLRTNDPGVGEQLRFELAGIHHEFGHDKAARKLWRELSLTAKDDGIKAESSRLLKETDAASSGNDGGAM